MDITTIQFKGKTRNIMDIIDRDVKRMHSMCQKCPERVTIRRADYGKLLADVRKAKQDSTINRLYYQHIPIFWASDD